MPGKRRRSEVHVFFLCLFRNEIELANNSLKTIHPMKTKKILMLMAAMLLSCASAFAQSGNTPAKGDVNEDGTVDVADIVAVIDIMKNGGGTATVGYFYLGTTKPTALNYKTLPGAVTSYASFDDAVGATASVAAGQTLYLLCPAAWVEEKTPTLEDKDGNSISFLEEKDEVTISDYVIYKTQVWNAPNDVVLKTETPTYYSYVGTDLNELLVEEATGYLKSDIAEQIKSIAGVKTYTSVPSSLETGITINARLNYVYVIAPTETLNNASIYLTNTSGGTIGTETLGTFNIDSTEYTVKCTPSEVGTVLTAWK